MTEPVEPLPESRRSRRPLVLGVAAACVVAATTAVLLITSERDAREVADGVVAALGEGDPEDYESLLCASVADDPAAALPPVLSKKPLTVTLRGLQYHPGENRPDGQIEHYRATVAAPDADIKVLLTIGEEDGSWCLLHARACPETIEHPSSSAAIVCRGWPERIETSAG